MRFSIYSTSFNILDKKFDYKDALDNWALYADQISIAVNTSIDDSYKVLEEYGKEKGYPLSLIKTNFSYDDPFCYGKIENAAMQNCDGDILIQQNLDERFLCDKEILNKLGARLLREEFIDAYFVPTIDLYGDKEHYLPPIKAKWYISKRGLYRGAVNFGLKSDGRPNYERTSTDELIDKDGNLCRSQSLLYDNSIEHLREYVKAGMPISFHTGYLNLTDRLSRSLWWKEFWNKATGDENKHPTSIEELANKSTEIHGLSLWNKI